MKISNKNKAGSIQGLNKKVNMSDVTRVVIDTETTGLGSGARVVEVGCVCADTGQLIYSQLINPEIPIEPEATAVSGITDVMVKDCPIWPEVRGVIANILKGRLFVAFNADFDYRLIMQTEVEYLAKVQDVRFVGLSVLQGITGMMCIQEDYKNCFNMPHPTKIGKLKRQSLARARLMQDIVDSDCQAHRAIDDALLAQRLLKKMEEFNILTYSQIMGGKY